MIARKIALAACAAALTTSPAWAHEGREHARRHGNHGRPHRCVAHGVAYVAAGTLTGHTLVLDGSGGPTPTVSAARADKPTYSGDVTIDVRRTNRHARADKGTTKTYTLDHARVVLALEDQNDDGRVDLGDVQPGSRAKVIGKVTKLRRACDQTGFAPALTIKKLIVHAPAQPQS
ncbi:MAG TPA: hypothetical protein VFS37_02335 [Conexibacter sp.]|nr:hypothetical protein [Conexibacter sp.]